jgi:hypothetical protein
MIGLELSQKQQRLMIKIEINPVNISTNTCLQNTLTKNKEHHAQYLLIHMNHTLMDEPDMGE